MIVCAGDIEQFDFALPIGIGLIDSAINLTKLCLKKKVSSITFVATAGSYGEFKIFDIITSSRACNIEQAFLRDDAYSPLKSEISFDNLEATLINSSNYICTSKEISKRYLEFGIGAENMEFYSVMKVAKAMNIKARGVFVITNYCDKNAHKDFLNNHKKGMNILKEYIKKREYE